MPMTERSPMRTSPLVGSRRPAIILRRVDFPQFFSVSVEQVRIKLGQSDFPPTPPHGGSMTVASVGSAVRAACLALKNEVARCATTDRRSPLYGTRLEAVNFNAGRLSLSNNTSCGPTYRDVVAVCGGTPIEAIGLVNQDTASSFSMYSFGAVF